MAIKHLDPRVIGRKYWSAYWNDTYIVLDKAPVTDDFWIRVQWSDGHIGTHCTSYDHKRDREVFAA